MSLQPDSHPTSHPTSPPTSPLLRPGQSITLDITNLSGEGQGVGRFHPARPDGQGFDPWVVSDAVSHGGGLAVFVPRTAPGDRVRVAITRVEKRLAHARLLEVLSPGPGRVTPDCPHYDRCGGCDLRHLDYPAQLRAKARVAQEQLARIGGLEWPNGLPPGDSPTPHPASFPGSSGGAGPATQGLPNSQTMPAPQIVPSPAVGGLAPGLAYRDRLDFATLDAQGRPCFSAWDGGPPLAVEVCRLAPPALLALAQAAGLALTRAGLAPQVARLRVQLTHGPDSSRDNISNPAEKQAPGDEVESPNASGETPGLALLVMLAPGQDAPRFVARAREVLHPERLRVPGGGGDPMGLSVVSVGVVGGVANGGEGGSTPRAQKGGKANKKPTPTTPQTQGPLVVHGSPLLAKPMGGLVHHPALDGFFQVNPAQARALRDHVVAQALASLAECPGTEPPPKTLPHALPPALAHAQPQALPHAPSQGRPTPPPPNRSRAWDLYGGVGLFALALAQAGVDVLGVEGQGSAVKAARQDARRLNLDKKGGAAWSGALESTPPPGMAEFAGVDLEAPQALEALARLVAQHGLPQVVIADPPRKGLSAGVLQALGGNLPGGHGSPGKQGPTAGHGGGRDPAPAPTLAPVLAPHTLIYVSCDGGSFSRDVKALAAVYAVRGITLFDMFPHTHHVEWVGVFTRRARTTTI